MDNFYQTLGVNENATQDEIKKAYRKLAVEHHPDKGGDENKFKKISEAYDTIGDENKRSQYDNQRSNPFGGGGGFDPFGGGFNPFGDMFGGMHTQRKRAVPDKIIEVNIGVLESYNAAEKTINYSRKHMCGDCNGSGGDKVNCGVCGGNGVILQRMGSGMFSQVVRQTCGNCSGKGFNFTKICGSCSGEGTKSSMDSITVKLPHAVDDGQFLRLQGKGDFKDGMYGNLVLKVKVNPENDFEKNGDDLIYNVYLTLEDLNKDSLEIPHPKGRLSVKLPNLFDTSKPLRVKSKGFNNGDLFINQIVKFNRV
jgi:molecular chaperone DnaJ